MGTLRASLGSWWGKGAGTCSNCLLNGSANWLSFVLRCCKIVNSYTPFAWSSVISRATMASVADLALPLATICSAAMLSDFTRMVDPRGYLTSQVLAAKSKRRLPQCHVFRVPGSAPVRVMNSWGMMVEKNSTGFPWISRTTPRPLVDASVIMMQLVGCLNALMVLTNGASFSPSSASMHCNATAMQRTWTTCRVRGAPSFVDSAAHSELRKGLINGTKPATKDNAPARLCSWRCPMAGLFRWVWTLDFSSAILSLGMATQSVQRTSLTRPLEYRT